MTWLGMLASDLFNAADKTRRQSYFLSYRHYHEHFTIGSLTPVRKNPNMVLMSSASYMSSSSWAEETEVTFFVSSGGIRTVF
jgi:hypothetical protein